MTTRRHFLAAAAILALGGHVSAQTRTPQEANGYTRYELLAPGSGKFRIKTSLHINVSQLFFFGWSLVRQLAFLSSKVGIFCVCLRTH